MIRRSIWAVIALTLVLTGQAFCQDSVKLAYKFTPGELLRYKMVANLTAQMTDPQSGQTMNIPIQMVAVMRQRVKKVLPNGDAQVSAAIESIKMNAGGNAMTVPGDKMPTMTMVLSPNGTVKGVQGLEKFGGMLPGMEFMGGGGFGDFGAVLPDAALNVGDTWAQQIPLPMGMGNVQIQSKLVSANTKIGDYRVAALKQDFGGDINLAMPLPVPSGETGASLDMKGTVLGNGTIYFSPDKGRMVRSEGRADMQMAFGVPAGQGSPGGSMSINMAMTFEMYLLPN